MRCSSRHTLRAKLDQLRRRQKVFIFFPQKKDPIRNFVHFFASRAALPFSFPLRRNKLAQFFKIFFFLHILSCQKICDKLNKISEIKTTPISYRGVVCVSLSGEKKTPKRCLHCVQTATLQSSRCVHQGTGRCPL